MPVAPGTTDVLANEFPMLLPLMLLPPQPKSVAGFVGIGEGALGAGSAQAFPPHTSEPPPIDAMGFETVVVVVAGDLG